MAVSELASWPAGTPRTPAGWALVIISALVGAPSPCPADGSSLLLLQSLENLILTLSVCPKVCSLATYARRGSAAGWHWRVQTGKAGFLKSATA